MKNKFLQFILLIVIIFIISFIVVQLYKMIVLFKIRELYRKNNDKEMYYVKRVDYLTSGIEIRENYIKGEKKYYNKVIFLNNKNDNYYLKEMNYINNNVTLVEDNCGKYYKKEILDNNIILFPSIIKDDSSFYDMIQIAIQYNVKKIKYLKNDVFLFNSNEEVFFVNKETGMVIRYIGGVSNNIEKNQKSYIVRDYFYDFNEIDDSIFDIPELTEYNYIE